MLGTMYRLALLPESYACLFWFVCIPNALVSLVRLKYEELPDLGERPFARAASWLIMILACLLLLPILGAAWTADLDGMPLLLRITLFVLTSILPGLVISHLWYADGWGVRSRIRQWENARRLERERTANEEAAALRRAESAHHRAAAEAERQRREASAARQHEAQSRREQAAREIAEEAERKKQAQERIERERAERERRELEDRERAARGRPAAREAILLLYTEHAALIRHRLTFEQLQAYLGKAMGENVPIGIVEQARLRMEERIARIVAQEQARRLFLTFADVIRDQFGEEMLDLYLADSMGDQRSLADVVAAGDRLREKLRQLYEASPLLAQKDRLEAERKQREQEEAEVRKWRAAGYADERIEEELAARRMNSH